MKNTSNLISKGALLLVAFSFVGCYNDVVQPVEPNPNKVIFENDIQPILTRNCVACHNGTIQPLDLREGVSFNTLMSLPAGAIVPGDALGSELYGMLTQEPTADNPMPPDAPISAPEIALFAQWINEGALNIKAVSFKDDIQAIFDQNCTACHNGTIQAPDLTAANSYASLMSLPTGAIVPGDAAGSELYGMLTQDPSADNPMPPAGPIPSSQIDLFAQWINQGALNN